MSALLCWLFYVIISVKYITAHIILVDSRHALSSKNQTGFAWNSSFNSLQTAFNLANSNDEIWISKGLYYGGFNITNKNNIKIIGGFNGNETSINEINYNNIFINSTILSANKLCRVIKIHNTTNISLSNLIISNGAGLLIDQSADLHINNLRFDSNVASNGAGMALIDVNNICIENCKFVENIAGGNGGGIWLFLSDNVTINNSEFYYNQAQGGDIDGSGAAIYVNSSMMTITNSHFAHNVAVWGGAIYATNISSDLMIIASIFETMHVYEGAALAFYGTNTSTACLYVIQCKITHTLGRGLQIRHSNNVYVSQLICLSNRGSCIDIVSLDDGVVIHIENSIFENNTAVTSYGAAIYLQIASMYIIKNSSFVGNYGLYGGAIHISDVTKHCRSIFPMLMDAYFDSNGAIDGGAIYIDGLCSILTMQLLYFESNIAKNGAAMFVDFDVGLIQIQNTTFKSNDARYNGSAVYLHNYANNSIYMSNCRLLLNKCGQNGAVYITTSWRSWFSLDYNGEWLNPKIDMNLHNCTFFNNNAENNGAAIYVDGHWNRTLTLRIFSSLFSNNTAMNGGGLYLASHSGASYIQNSLFQYNHANDTGGCLFVEEETNAKLSYINFTGCSAINGGGALYSESSNIKMDYIAFKSSEASMGGAIFFSQCSNENNTNLLFQQNSAEYAGGAMAITNNTCDTDQCLDCVYENNSGGYGDNIGSIFPNSIDISFNNVSKVDQLIPINIDISLYDKYNQLMKKTNYVVTFMVNIMNSSDLRIKLNGTYNETATDGSGHLSFYIKPEEIIQHKDVSLDVDLQLVIITPINTTKGNYMVTFYNEVHKTPNWNITFSFVLFAIVVISGMITSVLLIKYRNDPIIINGIPVYLAVILAGTIVLSFIIILMQYIPHSVPCPTVYGTLWMAFALICGPICAKISYIWEITFISHHKFHGYNEMNLKARTMVFIVFPVVCVVYLLLRILQHPGKLYGWEVIESTGINFEYCDLRNPFVTGSQVVIAIIVLIAAQMSMNIKDCANEYNTKTMIISSVILLITAPFFAANSAKYQINANQNMLLARHKLDIMSHQKHLNERIYMTHDK